MAIDPSDSKLSQQAKNAAKKPAPKPASPAASKIKQLTSYEQLS